MENEQPKARKVVDWIKYKNIKDVSTNYSALKGLNRVNKMLSRFIKWGLIGFFVGLGSLTYYKFFQEITQNGIKNFEAKLNALDDKERLYLLKHKKLSLEYGNLKNILRSEDKIGISYYRDKLLKNASGLVLETCCGAFQNKDYYTNDVKNIIALDWCQEIMTFGIMNLRDDTRLIKMDCTNIDYEDNVFDTVVDTFGLQASHDYKKQFDEMKRVCKVGGKILLLEIGLSLWKSTNFYIIKNADKEFVERGQHLYRNWDELILNDPSIKITKNKRKLNGRLFYYELEKLY